VVAIMTPNDSHFEFAFAALTQGFDVICDKPMTNTVLEATQLHQRVNDTGLVFCLTHNYTGYPMVRQAKAMVANGELGDIRLVQVEYVQGGRASAGSGKKAWKEDPQRGGPSLVMGDIGTHAHNLLRFITGLEVSQVAAEVGSIVPDRITHDFAGALLRLSNGARGSFWVTQAAAGVENALRIRVSGSLGSLEWQQECPQALDAGRKDFIAYVTSKTVVDANIAAGMGVKQLGDALFLEKNAVALDKASSLDSASAVEAIDNIVKEMHGDGTLSGFSIKWFGTDLTQGLVK